MNSVGRARTTRFAQWTLIYLLLVILFGAWVRVSGSGAGCGAHWPLCNGDFIPLEPTIKTLTEYTHRVTSGVSLLLCFALTALTFKHFPRGSRTRKAGVATGILIITEALVGAGLVLFRLVEKDQSLFRAISLGVHLVNTFFLIAAVQLTALWSKEESHSDTGERLPRPKDRRARASGLTAIGSMLLVGTTGAVTALGDTLFPAESLRAGMAQDLSSTSHFLIKLRILHPSFAVMTATYLCVYAMGHLRGKAAAPARLVITAVLSQLLLGFINLVMLAPSALQIAHLLLADVTWLLVVTLVAKAWFDDPVTQPTRS